MNYEAMAQVAVTLILTLQSNVIGGVLFIVILLAIALLLHVRKK